MVNSAIATTFILFQGDSITDCGRLREPGDPGHELGHGYPNLIASELSCRYPDSRLGFANRGRSGDRASDLYARWNEDALALAPDVISVLVGVNDVWRRMKGEPSGAFDRFERSYRGILSDTREFLPRARLILCEPFVLNAGAPAEDWAEWSSRVVMGQQLAEQFTSGMTPADAAQAQAMRAQFQAWMLSPEGHAGMEAMRLAANAAFLLFFAVAGGALGARVMARTRRPEV